MAGSLVRKLLVKPGQRLALVNAPPHYLEALAPLPDGVMVVDLRDSPVDAIHLFVRNQVELRDSIAPVLGAIPRDGLLWIAYPKGGAKAGTDINRDILHGSLEEERGWTGVTLVAIDDVWSAMRFRPLDRAPQ